MGRKLFGKSGDEILEKIVKKFEGLRIMAVQQFPDIIRVTYNSEDTVLKVLNFSDVRLFDMWCQMDGVPLQLWFTSLTTHMKRMLFPLRHFLKVMGKSRRFVLSCY